MGSPACDAAVARASLSCRAAPHSHGIYTFCRFFLLVFMTVFCLSSQSESVSRANVRMCAYVMMMAVGVLLVESHTHFQKRKKNCCGLCVIASLCGCARVCVCVSETACSSEYKRVGCVKIIKEPARSKANTKNEWERKKFKWIWRHGHIICYGPM